MRVSVVGLTLLFATSAATTGCGGRSIRTVQDDETEDIPPRLPGPAVSNCDAFCSAAARCPEVPLDDCRSDCDLVDDEARLEGCTSLWEEYLRCLLERDVCLTGYLCLEAADRISRCLASRCVSDSGECG